MLETIQSDAEQVETGFGTGLRAHIEQNLETTGHEDDPHAAAPEAPHAEEPETATTPEDETPPEPTAETGLDERARILDEAEAGIRRRARELGEQQQALDAEAARLSSLAAELEAQAAEQESAPRRHAREVLRERVEQEAAQLWQVFQAALEASAADGAPDHSTRIAAARALLAEAYGDERPEGEPPPEDELARIRDRRAGQQT